MKKNLAKVIFLVTLAFFATTAQGCPEDSGSKKPGKAKKAATPIFTKSDSFNLNRNLRFKIVAPKATPDCTWWLLWDIPGRDGESVQMAKHGPSAGKTTANLGMTKSFTYIHPVTKKKIIAKKAQPSTFVTSGCGPWYRA